EGAGDLPSDVERKLFAIHQLLHRDLLTQYNAAATDLAGTLDTGVYNCASAALLFVALTTEAGVNAQGLELPGHVRMLVVGGGGEVEMETTCPNWEEAVRRRKNLAANRDRDTSQTSRRPTDAGASASGRFLGKSPEGSFPPANDDTHPQASTGRAVSPLG